MGENRLWRDEGHRYEEEEVRRETIMMTSKNDELKRKAMRECGRKGERNGSRKGREKGKKGKESMKGKKGREKGRSPTTV